MNSIKNIYWERYESKILTNNMKKLLTYFFVTLGIIFFMILCAGAYVWFADPFEIRPLVSMLLGSSTNIPVDTIQTQGGASQVDKNPALSPTQESALESIGVDPAKLPSTITPEMEICFTEKLGSTRVSEIKGGDSPTPTEVFTARSCYE
jgi:hypothetical protein